MNGILLDNDNDLLLLAERDNDGLVKKGLRVGNTTIQDTYIVLKAHQGEIKSDPVIGANLTDFMRGKANKTAIEKRIKIQLTRAGIDFDKVKNEIQTLTTLI